MTRPKTHTPMLSHQWRRWVAEHKMRHVQDDAIIEFMTRNGVTKRAALDEVRTAATHPYVEAGTEKAEALQNLEDLVSNYQTLDALFPVREVERRSDVPGEVFLQDYYARNRPVILTNLMRDWKALSRWTPEYLKSRYGHELIEIVTKRTSGRLDHSTPGGHKRTLPMSDYVDMVTDGGNTNDYYMVAINEALERGGMQGLLEDVEAFPEYLKEKGPKNIRLWFGPAGTVTSLHRDPVNVLMAQVYGRKRVKLIPASQLQLVYIGKDLRSKVDCENPDYDQYPLFRDATVVDVIVGPGEALFIPVGWFHHVRALDVSISLSLVDFVFPNIFR